MDANVRYLVQLMYRNGARLKLVNGVWRVDVDRPFTEFHYSHVDRAIALGMIEEVKASNQHERHFMLTDDGCVEGSKVEKWAADEVVEKMAARKT